MVKFNGCACAVCDYRCVLCCRAVKDVKFSYLLKTDDDCFVDVVRVLQRLSEISESTQRVWLGRSTISLAVSHDLVNTCAFALLS